ncbi:hypothetical protein KY358_03950 [Candidatus Woesearchaeota archaeon]|nr:hypothetical protein [Candidatus Woesearchaeota archaeon]
MDTKNTLIFILLAIAVFSFVFFGITGFKVLIGALAFFLLPSFLILRRLNIPLEEKMVFSFFLGIGLFPSLVYYLGILIGLRKAIISSFILLVAIGLIINKIKK